MSITRDEVIDVASYCCFEELVVVGVIFNSCDIFLRSNELSKIADRFDLILYFLFIHMESVWILQQRFTELGERLHRDNDLVLVVESLDK